MRDSKIALLRNAIENTKQIQAIARDLPRVFCPHILGTRNGHWYVVVWQFEGYSNSGDLPNWRYLRLDELNEIQVRDGPWHSGLVRRRRRRTFPMDRVDSIADPDHIGYIGTKRSGFSLPGTLYGLVSNRLGRLPKKRPFAAKSPGDLRDKRAEISDKIAELKKELSRQQADLAHVDATLRAFAAASHGLAPGNNDGSFLNSGHTRKSAR